MRLKIYLMLFFLTANINAADNANEQPAQSAEFQKINAATVAYSECLQQHALSQIERQQQGDPRVIADYSMKACASILEDLYNDLSASYPPEALRRMTRSISSRHASKLLFNIMKYVASSTDTTTDSVQ